jgi:hypothetical protein
VSSIRTTLTHRYQDILYRYRGRNCGVESRSRAPFSSSQYRFVFGDRRR